MLICLSAGLLFLNFKFQIKLPLFYMFDSPTLSDSYLTSMLFKSNSILTVFTDLLTFRISVMRRHCFACLLSFSGDRLGAVAKYCDEYVCLCVWLSVREDISGTTRAIFTKFLCMLPMFVARSSSGMVAIGRIAYRREGGDGSAHRLVLTAVAEEAGLN